MVRKVPRKTLVAAVRQRHEYAISLFRTQVVPNKKHEGLSQFLVDLKNTKGISIRPMIGARNHLARPLRSR